MSLLKLLSLQETPARIEALATSAKNVQAEIHLIGVSCLAHARDHGDVRPMAQLLNALPNGQRVRGLVAWARNFSSKKLSIKQDTAKQWVVEISGDAAARTVDFKVDESMAITFADYTVEKDPTSVTVESMIRNLARTANNDEMFEGTNTPKVTPEARAVAASLVAQYRASAAKAVA